MIKEARYYARMAWYFAGFLRHPAIADPRHILQETLDRREENFLDLVRTGVYDNPASPFLELLRLADCSYDDLAALVSRHGLEPALEQLRAAGVYLSHAEAKGAPIVRSGRVIANHPGATGHPRSPGGMESLSSGSRSRSTTTPATNGYRLYREFYETIQRREIGADDRVTATLHSILPAPAGLLFCAGEARSGRPAARWFTSGGTVRDAAPYRVVTNLLVFEARLLGRPMPRPTYLAANDFWPVVAWIAECRTRGRSVLIRGSASASTRVCAVARDRGIDISGTIFVTSGEAVSAAKRRLMDDVGARAYPRYVISELGTIGLACSHTLGNSVHWFSDSTAIISHRRAASFADSDVNSLLFTSIHPLASQLFINVEMEDEARMVPARCDCEFSRLGFTTLLEDVQSFGKLTGHGLTLAGTDMVALIEERLPARFGGAPGDYQLVQYETERQAEVCLRISPRVPTVDPATVHDFFMNEVRAMHGGALSRRVWMQTSSLKAEIAEPYRTRTGKVLALHLTTVEKPRAT